MDEVIGFTFDKTECTGEVYPQTLSIRLCSNNSTQVSKIINEHEAYYVDDIIITKSQTVKVEIIQYDKVIYSWDINKEDVYTEKLIEADPQPVICIYRKYSNTQGQELKRICQFLFNKDNTLTIPQKLNELFKLYQSHKQHNKKYAKYRRFYIRKHKRNS